MKLNYVLFILACLSATTLFAQPCPPGCPDIVPIDGGISLLVAAGVAYGAKKVHERKKKAQ